MSDLGIKCFRRRAKQMTALIEKLPKLKKGFKADMQLTLKLDAPRILIDCENIF